MVDAVTVLQAYGVPSYEIATSELLSAWDGASEVVLASIDCAASPSDSPGLGAVEVGSGSSWHWLNGAAAVLGAVVASFVLSRCVVAAAVAEGA